jgi:bifunctional ADP-heptose synthase (sugar kinase/adenylyltransferase)
MDLDTRSKIISRGEARERLGNRPARWVSADFDPMLAEHVRRLRQFKTDGQALVVEITNPAKPLLSQRARAELAAAVSLVDFVVMSDSAGSLAATSESIGDSGITEHFVQHVLERHRAEGSG